MTGESYEVRYDPEAIAALEEAVAYIAEQSGADRALGWLDAIRAGIERLETSPRVFRSVCHRRGRLIRSKLVVNHRVYYFIDEQSRLVYVIDVVHTARETKLAEYRDSED